MFVLIVMEDIIKILPEQFDINFTDVLIQQIESKYSNRVIPDVGLCISFYDFIEISDPYSYPSEGAAHQLTKFRLVVFRPFPTEIIIGKVIASTNEGLLISLGFFDNIIIPKNLLQSPSVFNSETEAWNWKYDGCDETDDDLSFTISIGDKVRFAIRTVTFTKATTNSKGVQSFITTSTTTSEQDNDDTVVRKRSTSIDILLQEKNSSGSTISSTTVTGGNTGDTASMGAISALGGGSSINNTLETHSKVNQNQLASLQSSSFDSKTDAPEIPLRLPSHHHPMRVIGSIDGDGLGLLSWWE